MTTEDIIVDNGLDTNQVGLLSIQLDISSLHHYTKNHDIII